jgi:hypothetical protein
MRHFAVIKALQRRVAIDAPESAAISTSDEIQQ